VSAEEPRGTVGGRSRPAGPVVAAVVWVLASAAAFAVLDPVIAAFASILGLTLVVIAFLSSDWVGSPSSFEEREAARARRRQAKWDAGAAARARDRARWEAHQARKADRSDR
jgi:hypothetical protein